MIQRTQNMTGDRGEHIMLVWRCILCRTILNRYTPMRNSH